MTIGDSDDLGERAALAKPDTQAFFFAALCERLAFQSTSLWPWRYGDGFSLAA